MKKAFLFGAVFCFVAVSFTSCKKADCIECNLSGTVTVTCEEDYVSAGGVSWKQWSDLMATSSDCKKVKK